MKNVWTGSTFDFFFSLLDQGSYLSEKQTEDVLIIKIALDPLYDHYHRSVFAI
jgi:hypothetical protein